MPVRPRGDPGAGVAEDVSGLLERDAGCGQQARGRVPQLVRVPPPQAGLLGDSAQGPSQVGRVEQRAAAGWEDQPEVLPVLPHLVRLSDLSSLVLPPRTTGSTSSTPKVTQSS